MLRSQPVPHVPPFIGADSNRTVLIVQNLYASQDVYSSLGENSTAQKGIAIPGGETLVLHFGARLMLWPLVHPHR